MTQQIVQHKKLPAIKNTEEKDLIQEYSELDKKIEETIKKIKNKKLKIIK